LLSAPPYDLRVFSSSIVKLLKDKKLRAFMGKAGKAHVEKNFLVTRLMIDWLDLMRHSFVRESEE
jgi:hypothetical protein